MFFLFRIQTGVDIHGYLKKKEHSRKLLYDVCNPFSFELAK